MKSTTFGTDVNPGNRCLCGCAVASWSMTHAVHVPPESADGQAYERPRAPLHDNGAEAEA